MNLSLDTSVDEGEYFINFTHVRDGENYHIYLRLKDIKLWESVAMSRSHDRATRWRLETVHGDVYFTLNNFNEIMTTSRKYPRSTDGSGTGRVGDDYLYRGEDE
jgi:hypothetical protein